MDMKETHPDLHQKMNTRKRYKGLLERICNAWESLPEGRRSTKEIENWLIDDMKPAIDDIRRELGRKTKK